MVCNNCPVKATCTDSDHGREIRREVDPWPHSEAGRFHRGIACSIALLALLLPLAMLTTRQHPAAAIMLLAVACAVLLASLPLVAHLRHSPTGYPAHLQLESTEPVQHPDPGDAARSDRFATRWNAFDPTSRRSP